MAIIVNLDVEMAKNKISLNELSERVGITPANLSILKTGKAKAIRFSTLEAICKVLNCQPGDILTWINDPELNPPVTFNAEGN
ncbi:MAG: helix-turn-helix transcriptional regulator [Porphyromonadaceae bacterium]|nr:helix-turn-helix transcriptional regulator [Porphyromonadaceae bacterium]